MVLIFMIVFVALVGLVAGDVENAFAAAQSPRCPKQLGNPALYDCNSPDCKCEICGGSVAADFMFLIDCSSSMQANIDAVRAGFSTFVTQLQAKAIDARYSVVLFGAVAPEPIVDFGADGVGGRDQDFTKTVLSQVIAGNGNNFERQPRTLVHFDHDCKHTARCGTRENGWEPARMALGEAGNNNFVRHPQTRTAEGDPTNPGVKTGPMVFRQGAQKYFILVTDEDSDCPWYDENRFPVNGVKQCSGPGYMVGDNDRTMEPRNHQPVGSAEWGPWQAEIDKMAELTIKHDLKIAMWTRPSQAMSRAQYGDPALQQSNGFKDFDGPATLQRLMNSAESRNSLQAQVLKQNPKANVQVFDVANIQNPGVIDSFFTQVAEDVVAQGGEACAVGVNTMSTGSLGDVCFQYKCDQVKGCVSMPRCTAESTAAGCGHCMINGQCVARLTPNPLNACEKCDSKLGSPTGWTQGCDDKDECTNDSCVNMQCVHEPVCSPRCGKCCIGGQIDPTQTFGINCQSCVATGTVQPGQNNPCMQCDPFDGNPLGWADLSQATKLDGQGNDVPVCTQSQACPAGVQGTLGSLGCFCLDGGCIDAAHSCSGSGLCEVAAANPSACVQSPGSAGCACTPGLAGSCQQGLTCSATTSLCQVGGGVQDPCAGLEGTMGCPCLAGQCARGTCASPGTCQCSASSQKCQAANAVSPECEGKLGTAGCPCAAGNTCTQGTCATASCQCDQQQNKCTVAQDACPTCGQAGFRCRTDGSCNAGLKCLVAAHLCVVVDSSTTTDPNNNPAGGDQCLLVAGAGCPCKSGNVCDAGAVCQAGFCSLCPEGSAGCSCMAGGLCSSGATCAAGVCCNATPGSACALTGQLGGACRGDVGSMMCDGSVICHPGSKTCVPADQAPPTLVGCDDSLTQKCYDICSPNDGACTCESGRLVVECALAIDSDLNGAPPSMSTLTVWLLLVTVLLAFT